MSVSLTPSDIDGSTPWDDAIEVGPLVRYEWTPRDHWYHRAHEGWCHQDAAHLLVWHDCGHVLGDDSIRPGGRYGWRASGVLNHTVTQAEPLTVVASIYWPECCGLHGFITDGRWIDA